MGEWTVREVVAHLAVVAGFYTDSINRGASGDDGTSGDRPPPGSGRGALAAPGVQKGASRTAEKFGEEIIDRMHDVAHVLADTLDADESDLGFGCYHPGGILPATHFMVLYLKELGLHEWDIFEALEPPCTMSRWGVDAAFQAMEQEVASGSLRWVTDPDSADTHTFRVTLTGDVDAVRDLVLEPHQTCLLPRRRAAERRQRAAPRHSRFRAGLLGTTRPRRSGHRRPRRRRPRRGGCAGPPAHRHVSHARRAAMLVGDAPPTSDAVIRYPER